MLFEHIQIEVQCSKKYFKNFLSQEAGGFRKNRRRSIKAMPKIDKRMLNIYRE